LAIVSTSLGGNAITISLITQELHVIGKESSEGGHFMGRDTREGRGGGTKESESGR
jgi:hypothetical protein